MNREAETWNHEHKKVGQKHDEFGIVSSKPNQNGNENILLKEDEKMWSG